VRPPESPDTWHHEPTGVRTYSRPVSPPLQCAHRRRASQGHLHSGRRRAASGDLAAAGAAKTASQGSLDRAGSSAPSTRASAATRESPKRGRGGESWRGADRVRPARAAKSLSDVGSRALRAPPGEFPTFAGGTKICRADLVRLHRCDRADAATGHLQTKHRIDRCGGFGGDGRRYWPRKHCRPTVERAPLESRACGRSSALAAPTRPSSSISIGRWQKPIYDRLSVKRPMSDSAVHRSTWNWTPLGSARSMRSSTSARSPSGRRQAEARRRSLLRPTAHGRGPSLLR
jgi:hypothetical protein